MEKSELKRQGAFGVDFPHKKVSERDIMLLFTTTATFLAAFLMGRVVLFGMMSLLSIAFVFSFIGEDRRFYGIWAAAFLGILLYADVDLWRYTAILVFAMISDILAKERGGVSGIRKAVFCALAVVITGMIKYIAVERLDFVIFITAVETLLSFLAAMAFNGAKNTIKTGKILSDNSICLYFALSAAVTGISGVYIYVINLYIVAAVFMIMYFSMVGNMSGAAMGTLLGLFSIVGGEGDMSLFAAFAVMGLVGSAFRFLGKTGIAVASAFVGSAMLFYVGGSFLDAKTVISMVISSAVFLVVPNMISFEKGMVTADSSFDVFKEMSAERMASVSTAIESISLALDNATGTVENKERIDRIIDSTVSQVCGDCGLAAYCWGSEIDTTYKGFYKFTGECGKNGSVTVKDMPDEIAKNCVRVKMVTDVTNRNLDFYRQDMVWDNRIKEYKAADRKRMEIIGGVLGEIAESIKKDYKPDKKFTAKVVNAVKDLKNDVKVQAYTVKGVSGVYAIGAGVDISPILNTLSDRKYALTGSSSNGEEADIYTALPKFKATFAVSTKAKTGNAVTGDSFGDVLTEKGVSIILSDGMGTGDMARKESMRTVELAESFFKASIGGERAARLMDTVFINTEDVFATADILETDLYEGKAKFIKTGAAASFLVRDGRVKTIRSSSLPPGFFGETETRVTDIELKDDDIIIMITDGVTDALTSGIDEGVWIKQVVDEANSRDPRFIADSLIKAAERLRGIASDDMTVAVIRIWKPL